MEEFEKASCIQGFRIYQDNWIPILGKRLVCKNKPGNPRDQYAVAVRKAGDEIVGHLPRPGQNLVRCPPFKSKKHLIKKNSLVNFCDWRLIHKNHKRFLP